MDALVAEEHHGCPRGCTVLHAAVMCKEPKVIVALITKGACTSVLSLDGRTLHDIQSIYKLFFATS